MHDANASHKGHTMILIVDDDESIVKLLKQALEADGYRVETAQDGVEAYEHLKSPDCRAVLLDIAMPRLNGVELLLLMQADGITVPTIVMAGFVDFQEGEMKEFTNVVEFLPKPFELRAMTAAVARHALPR